MTSLLSGSAAVITHNVVPLRAKPDGGSEQISQAILGDRALLLAEQDDYVRARMADEYEGWIWHGHLRAAADGDERSAPHERRAGPYPLYYVSAGMADLFARPNAPETLITKLVLGTWLRVQGMHVKIHGGERAGHGPLLKVETPFCTGREGGSSNTVGHVAAGAAMPASAAGYQGRFSGAAACKLALQYIGTPYLWGGTTPFGFDCSGFVQRVYSLCNVLIPRDAYVQARSPLGVTLDPGAPVLPGDLIFFCGRSDPHRRGITHVGMALDAERFIHAYGKRGVVITRYDAPEVRAVYTTICAWRHRADVSVP